MGAAHVSPALDRSGGKEPHGRPATKQRDEIDTFRKYTIWQRVAQNRHIWKRHVESFAQRWTQQLDDGDDDDEPESMT